ncbi:MAG: DEAD/DEAH box helicase [Candidatus Abyssobacteria bacterium SURF_5]|uniref:DEAD/DEAH box helicase n=1 Tax=Abyssobacteria bacterium (strain SURF_5) TaxID=2093360 RepID=A0A3A4NUY6_ABYX5|nr:MAG: DEAD/DEAH box helicase [Candidatus Abyssubacteria bacterium SURF_5]
MNLEQVLDTLKDSPRFMQCVTEWREIPPREAVLEDFPSRIDDRLQKVLRTRGIEKLYSHQRTALDRLEDGQDIVIITPTASGKTLCYNLPVLNTLLSDRDARALYLFPTKALSQDQVAELHGLITALGEDIRTYTYDGDTPSSARKAIRHSGHIVVTNPDMLHTGILPHHTKWIKLFEKLRYIVIDELHHYRGVFGSHVANVFRRLQRLCEFYNSSPQFICCSATIANPEELAEKIIGKPVSLVSNNGAPAGKKHFVLYNPPVVNRELGIRRSVVSESSRLAQKFLDRDIQTIVFGRSRLRVEILVTYLKEAVRKMHKSDRLIRGYRGGYLPNERREIEHGLRDGEIMAVVSTNALELGIDIGELDVSVMAGYPGTVASSWQQAGRAGRRNKVSAAFLLASSAPIDQYLINHTDYFFAQPPENGVIDPNNLIILMSHIKCAAFELPFRDGESFGVDTIADLLAYLEEHRVLRHADGRWYYTADTYPAEEVSLRSASPENVVIIDVTKNASVIGEIDLQAAPLTVYEGAIYIHESRQYEIERFDFEHQKAYGRQVDVDYYTDAESKTEIKVLDVAAHSNLAHGAKAHGEVSVTTLPVMYKKIKFHTHENIGSGRIHLPEQEMHTTSYWIDFRPDSLENAGLTEGDLGGGLKALSNVLVNVVPIYIMCDPNDIRSVSMVRCPFSQLPTIFIYDNYPGGVGYSQKIFRMHDMLLEIARELLTGCACESGCPSCAGPALEIGETGKKSALKLLDILMAEAAL